MEVEDELAWLKTPLTIKKSILHFVYEEVTGKMVCVQRIVKRK